MKTCIELKRKLIGKNQTYECKLIDLQPDYGLLKYILPCSYQVDNLFLPPNSLTYAFYWPARPYTLYRWYWPDKGGPLGNYFNIADQVELSPPVFSWRDLMVDILITPQDQIKVLDEEELPEAISPEMREYIKNAKSLIINNYNNILNNTDEIMKRLEVN